METYVKVIFTRGDERERFFSSLAKQANFSYWIVADGAIIIIPRSRLQLLSNILDLVQAFWVVVDMLPPEVKKGMDAASQTTEAIPMAGSPNEEGSKPQTMQSLSRAIHVSTDSLTISEIMQILMGALGSTQDSSRSHEQALRETAARKLTMYIDSM